VDAPYTAVVELLAYTGYAAGVELDTVLVYVRAGQLVTSGPQEVMVSMTVVL
jgi:hypothetical protein